jgi:large subunit ribosomal protein L19
MAGNMPHSRLLCCGRSLFREFQAHKPQRRSFVTIQRGPVQKLDLPPGLPKQYWPQLPARLRPDGGMRIFNAVPSDLIRYPGKREILIHEPPPSRAQTCKDPVSEVGSSQMALLDPTGARRRLFDHENREGAKVGDILLTTFKSGEPFSGVIMSIKQRGVDTSVLLRNHLSRIGTEMQVKIFSPLVQSMEVAQKTAKRKRRARLYYLRKPKHDMGSVQKIVDHYLRQRALLTGGGKAQGVNRAQQRPAKRR